MHISCPHCQANYEIETACESTALLCHRCGVEFSVADQTADSNERDSEMQENDSNDRIEPTIPEIAEATELEESGLPEGLAPEQVEIEAEEKLDITPPKRKKVRIWPWLMIMLILIFSAGFWLQKDAWLDNRWFRSTAINLGYPLPQRDKDWRVIPDSVQAEWIKRDDASQVLLIRGRVKNLLTSELPAPLIEVTFFSDLDPDQKLGSRQLIITLHPGKLAIGHVPYTTPAPNTVRILPQGEREFVFVIESPPENTGDFALAARAQ